MNVKRRVITVDGLAGSGKSSISTALAKKLGYAHLNSGILYRGVSLLARRLELAENEVAIKIEGLLSQNPFDLFLEDSTSRLRIGAEDVTSLLYSPEVSMESSKFSSIPEVRAALVRFQREAFQGHDLVAEGRDMGTVIFPEADLKFFIEVDVATRAARRLQQTLEKNEELSPDQREARLAQIARDIQERDRRDSERSISPTVAAQDAVHIDNSSETLTQVVQNMYDSAANKGLVRP